jgi:hypothetical protein
LIFGQDQAILPSSGRPLGECRIYHAAMLDPHTAAELDLRQIRALVDYLILAHGDWLPAWCRTRRAA